MALRSSISSSSSTKTQIQTQIQTAILSSGISSRLLPHFLHHIVAVTSTFHSSPSLQHLPFRHHRLVPDWSIDCRLMQFYDEPSQTVDMRVSGSHHKRSPVDGTLKRAEKQVLCTPSRRWAWFPSQVGGRPTPVRGCCCAHVKPIRAVAQQGAPSSLVIGESRHWAAASGCSRPDNDLEEEEAQRGTGINTIQSCVSRGRPSSLESRLDDERAVWPATASRPTTNYHQHPFSGWPWCPPVSFDPPSMIDHSTAAPLVITCWCHRCRTVPYS
ncbi:uncharacterized protein VDAG_04629 [Verticillium dahliae VdLs.17]|uniref:Uncharacterized protein n=1 Tax=Verticillium dahliae (strain VdLs.17 / ATCC MYA-4575 / FGSC 10137) TaxID=498257 RepID=G2X3P2_VERDV|nr:uncharacterized protein VDAG_04629 [Verticillium dahliae VdLs.17]EGY23191.1 hypothetical protein VDAG_04629 [Verticillium dahliae VdLs.17]KAH6689326.1 hypothetical protein EV126DRAFT_348513 [Verticillium dahliae]